MLPIRSKFLVATLLQRQTWVVPYCGGHIVRLEGVIKGQIPGQRTSKRFNIYVVVVVVGCCLLLEFVFSGCFLLAAICNVGMGRCCSHARRKGFFLRKKQNLDIALASQKAFRRTPQKFF